jgi:hypothetical protein
MRQILHSRSNLALEPVDFVILFVFVVYLEIGHGAHSSLVRQDGGWSFYFEIRFEISIVLGRPSPNGGSPQKCGNWIVDLLRKATLEPARWAIELQRSPCQRYDHDFHDDSKLYVSSLFHEKTTVDVAQ